MITLILLIYIGTQINAGFWYFFIMRHYKYTQNNRPLQIYV